MGKLLIIKIAVKTLIMKLSDEFSTTNKSVSK